jgi:hypothetical protein
MIDRRHFVKGISAACVASSGLTLLRNANAAEFSYRIAHTTPATHPLHLRLPFSQGFRLPLPSHWRPSAISP